MEDTVNWKFQTKLEDDHEAAEFFMSSTKNWIKCIKSLLFKNAICQFMIFSPRHK
jgi:hypothetical protein